MDKKRLTRQLSPRLTAYLGQYFLAGLAGLGAVPLVSKGAVVYTPARLMGEGLVGSAASVPLDLNHDGITDFTLVCTAQQAFSTEFLLHTDRLLAEPAGNNEAAASGEFLFTPEAQALRFGQKIGPNLNFQPPGTGGFLLAFSRSASGYPLQQYGNFFHQKNKFVALRFEVEHQTYYGWARIIVANKGNNLVFELVDYAYQNMPNTPIRAGEGIPKPEADLLGLGTDSMAPASLVPEARLIIPSGQRVPASLGMLAVGAAGIPAWRR